MMSTLVLIRHGQSQWNLENRFTGWVDVPLTEQGRAEAAHAGRRLKQEGLVFDHAWTSVLVRAKDTLDIVLSSLGQEDVPVTFDKALNERHYGDLQGLNKAETARKYGAEQVHIWRRSFDVAPPGEEGESLKDTAERTLPYFKEHIAEALRRGGTYLVVAHGNSLRSIVMHLDALNRDEILKLNIATGTPIVYVFDENLRVLSKTVMEP
ncbi:MAG: 2,3-diphosphoglycerate-dependent phosphoglycerate mutase [Candidatus Binatia bacterium]